MPFPPINLHSRIPSPGKELFRKKKASASIATVPPQSVLGHKLKTERKENAEESEKLCTSWPSSNLKQLGKQQKQHFQLHVQQQAVKGTTESGGAPHVEVDGKGSWVTGAKPLGSSCESVPRSGSSRHSSRASLEQHPPQPEEVRFSLSLTPEAVLVLQKRSLEKQMLAKQQQKCCGSADLRHRRVILSRRAQGSGGSSSKGPAHASDAPGDISALVKISLLNDQHKYDDVEYEEEDGDVDETVVRKCKEWLKGVESAAAFNKVDKLAALPHLKSC